MGHDVDPDYGNRRDFFVVSPAMWVERFADGYIKAFTVVGLAQVSGTVVSPVGGSGGRVMGRSSELIQGSTISFQMRSGLVCSWRIAQASRGVPAV